MTIVRRATAAAAATLLLAACALPEDGQLAAALTDAAAEAGDGGELVLADHAQVDAAEVIVVPSGTDPADVAEALEVRPPRRALAPVAEEVGPLIAFRDADGGVVWSVIDADDLDVQLDGTYDADIAAGVSDDDGTWVLSDG